MSKKPTKAQTVGRVFDLAVEFYVAQSVARILRERLHAEYSAFFWANGEVETGYRRIDPSNPAYAPVIAHTAEAYARYQKARSAKNNAKRRMENAIRAAIGPVVVDSTPTAAPPIVAKPTVARRPELKLVKRTTDCGETLQ
ncbi:hypothetical protein ACI77I_06780 [Pseudomonas sp. D47]|uniref:hypothetical protein n=1 Tax=Pseudomonas sp. D47 TaxID=3159447 RepID=UPI00387B9C84